MSKKWMLFIPGVLMGVLGYFQWLPIGATANGVLLGLGIAGIIGALLGMFKLG